MLVGMSSGVVGEVRRSVEEDACPTQVQVTRGEHLMDLGEAGGKLEGDIDLGFGAAAGQMQCGTDFSGGSFRSVGSSCLLIVEYVDDRGHVRVHRRRVVRHQPLVGA